MKTTTKLWIGIAVLIVLSPLGIILPAKFGAGSAWGEWSKEEVSKMVGYMPSGMSKLADKWKAPMPDYAFKGQEDAPIRSQSASYIISGIIGVGLVVLLSLIFGRIIAKREHSDNP
ncbi:MAG: PDGLE domain-containing protein [Armatimonadota bacterium]